MGWKADIRLSRLNVASRRQRAMQLMPRKRRLSTQRATPLPLSCQPARVQGLGGPTRIKRVRKPIGIRSLPSALELSLRGDSAIKAVNLRRTMRSSRQSRQSRPSCLRRQAYQAWISLALRSNALSLSQGDPARREGQNCASGSPMQQAVGKP